MTIYLIMISSLMEYWIWDNMQSNLIITNESHLHYLSKSKFPK